MLECTRIFVIDEFQYLYSNINYFVHNNQMLVYIDIGVIVGKLTGQQRETTEDTPGQQVMGIVAITDLQQVLYCILSGMWWSELI